MSLQDEIDAIKGSIKNIRSQVKRSKAFPPQSILNQIVELEERLKVLDAENVKVESFETLKVLIEAYLKKESTKKILLSYPNESLAKSNLAKHLLLLFKADIDDIHSVLDQLL